MRMKKLVMGLLALPFVFSCNRSDEDVDINSDEGKIRIELTTQMNTIHPSAEANIVLLIASSHLDEMTVPNINWNTRNGVKQMFDFKETENNEGSTKYNSLLEQTKGYQRDYKPSKGRIIIQPSHPVKKFFILYSIADLDSTDGVGSSGILRIKVYVDNKLKISHLSGTAGSMDFLKVISMHSIKELRKLPDINI